ncbi:MAG: hypothetical protein JWL86_2140 [Rhizobium sp.]|nr:hypothetical protein [Rhizobium sp.]
MHLRPRCFPAPLRYPVEFSLRSDPALQTCVLPDERQPAEHCDFVLEIESIMISIIPIAGETAVALARRENGVARATPFLFVVLNDLP